MTILSPKARSRSNIHAFLACGLLTLTSIPFGLYAHNSGYGYDQLEYLIIGRSLVDGYRFYDLIPSKSPGIYLLVAAFLNVGWLQTHAQLAVLIAAIYVLLIVCSFVFAQRLWSVREATAGAGLVGLCAWFMELNFLQPTAFVYLFGLAACGFCIRAVNGHARRNWFLCGAMVAFGMQFKTVAAFYGVAAGALLLKRHWRDDWLRHGAAFASGVLVPSAAVAAWFAATGRGRDFWEWTVYFPLFKYPANTWFLSKLYTKLLIFDVVFACAIAAAMHPRIRRAVWGDFRTLAVFVFGAVSLLALTKTQASHYCFPGAAFLSLFSARVGALVAERAPERSPRSASTGFVIAAVGLAVASAFAYRPQAFARLATVRRFQEETSIARYVAQSSLRADHVIAFSNPTWLYWIAHRYPNTRLIHTDVQNTYFVAGHPDALVRALDDPTLRLVEFNPLAQEFADPEFSKVAAARAEMQRFKSRLEQRFRPDPTSPVGYHFWVRNESKAAVTIP
jgi:hypothetical protein